jgi:hypothetical protein
MNEQNLDTCVCGHKIKGLNDHNIKKHREHCIKKMLIANLR